MKTFILRLTEPERDLLVDTLKAVGRLEDVRHSVTSPTPIEDVRMLALKLASIRPESEAFDQALAPTT